MQTHYDDFFEEVFVELETKVSHVIDECYYNKYKAHCVQYKTKNIHLWITLSKTILLDMLFLT